MNLNHLAVYVGLSSAIVTIAGEFYEMIICLVLLIFSIIVFSFVITADNYCCHYT